MIIKDSHDRSLRELLTSSFFQVPRFQRPYAWEDESLQDFWNDIVADAPNAHFLGSMVVYEENPKVPLYGIVDGQQRLTTALLILCALRNAARAEQLSTIADGIHRTLLQRADVDNKSRFVLDATTSYPFLQEHILRDGTPETDGPIGAEQERLAHAFDFMLQQVGTAVEVVKSDTTIKASRKPAMIEDRIKTIRDRVLSAHLIFISIDNEDDAYLAFETLNTRGKDLTVSDLVINHVTRLIRRAPPAVDVPRDKWRAITQRLEQSQLDLDLNQFLLHAWLSRHEYVAEKKLFRSIKRHVQGKPAAKSFLAELEGDSVLYRQINETGIRKWSQNDGSIPDSLRSILGVFGVEQPLPLLLALMRQYDAKTLKKKHVEDVLRAIEYFHFSFTAIAGRSSSGGTSQMYARHARELSQANSAEAKITTLSALKAKLYAGLPTQDEFVAGFKALRFSSTFTRQRPLVHYILSGFARTYSPGNVLNCDAMTIEHIAPQSGPLPYEAFANIGNLILVDDATNNRLDSKAFGQKQAILRKTSVPGLKAILGASKWDGAEIATRAEAMAQEAYKDIWGWP
jgi:Protein of unknown function DUF262/Protein of unknown function (DUF1524)